MQEMPIFYLVIEPAGRGFSGTVPDLPVYATGETQRECRDRLTEALVLYRREARRNREPLLRQRTIVEKVEVR